MSWWQLFWFWLIIYLAVALKSDGFHSDSIEVPSLLLGNLQLTLSSKLLLDIFSPSSHTLNGYLGWLPKSSDLNYTSCSGDESVNEKICLKYGKHMKLTIRQDDLDRCEKDSMTCHAVPCYKFHWENHIGGTMDCFLLGEDFWYGGGETISPRWPLQSINRSWYPSVTGDPLHHLSGSVVENLWISSGGFSIFVEQGTPLFVSFNETGNGKLCFTTSRKHPYHAQNSKYSALTYSICSAGTIKDVYTASLHKWIQKPFDTPHEKLFNYPIWSTWARYKRDINETTVLNYATEITEFDFPANQLEIDDKWENCYGNLQFNKEKFPDPAALTSKLRDLGFVTTLWVHPFCHPDCETYHIGQKQGYWVKDKNGTTLNVQWWNGEAAVLDVTNKKARQWFVKRLQELQKNFGIESFKFDAGEILWFDKEFSFHDPKANLEPNTYSQLFAETAAEFGNRVEVRIGYKTQQLSTMVRVFDKYSTWDYANGLQAVIPNILHLSLLGYFFTLPDMVGGNNYDFGSKLPDRELYIRWLELNTLLPFIQFSITPWDYDTDVIAIAKKMLSIREKYMDYIMTISEKTTTTGEPLIRPVWWVAPDDAEALQIDSEFLIGDSILVAPVLTKGANRRDIYIPEGRWIDPQKGKVYENSQWILDYKAPLNFLPFFIRNVL